MINIQEAAELDQPGAENSGTEESGLLYADLIDIAGIDVNEDIDAAVIAFSGNTGNDISDNTIIARTIINSGIILDRMKNESGLFTEKIYSGVKILKDTAKDSGTAFISGDIIASGKISDIKNIIDISRGSGLGIILNSTMLSYINEVKSITVYHVSGLVTGNRVEWSVYIKDDSGKTRYMIVDARQNSISMDPVNLFIKAAGLEHSVQGNRILTDIEYADNSSFTSTIKLPDAGYEEYAVSTREWVQANDYIYWTNGINDRVYYGGNHINAEILSIDPAAAQIGDTTPWSDFIEPVPEHFLVFTDKIEFIISPWWNLNEL